MSSHVKHLPVDPETQLNAMSVADPRFKYNAEDHIPAALGVGKRDPKISELLAQNAWSHGQLSEIGPAHGRSVVTVNIISSNMHQTSFKIFRKLSSMDFKSRWFPLIGC